MKHIKLFENFNEEPDIYDALHIVITHLGEVKEVEIDPKWNDNSLIKLNRLEKRHHTEVRLCEEHLIAEGFFLYMPPNRVTGDFIIVGIGNSLEDYCINWLNNRFGDLKEIKQTLNISDNRIGPKTFYIDKNNKPLFYFYKSLEAIEGSLKTYYISSDEIYLFFKEILDPHQTPSAIDKMTKKWLEEKYEKRANSLFWMEYSSMKETFEKSCEKPIS